ncbi:hypothetical protein QQ045_013722 [Rhodiola kirilowii]
MGKREGKQKIANSGIISGGGVNNGKKQSKSALLKLDHLQNLAVWASGDAAVPSLGAFFGNRFAACGEAMGVQPDQSLFICERCETILHPGDNCTVRIEKIKARKRQKHKGSKAPTQNNVVYRCHFCSHQTVKRGTLRAHMKQICPQKNKPAPKSRVSNAAHVKNTDTELCTESVSTPATIEHLVMEPLAEVSDNASSAVEMDTIENIDGTSILDTPAPVTPLLGTSRSLLDRKKRTRNKPAGSKKDPECCSANTDETSTTSASKKRRRKTWTSLKDLAKSTQNGNSRNLSDLTIPFFL